MKNTLLFCLLLILFGSFSTSAQDLNTSAQPPHKFYIGINYTNTQFFLESKKPTSGYSPSGPNFIPYPGVHLGYRLGNRTSIQIGVAYAHENWYWGSEYNNAGSLEGNFDSVRVRGGIIPLSFRYNVLNLGKRLQVYGTASLTAAFGQGTLHHTSTVNQEVTEQYVLKTAALNMYLSLGMGLHYNLGKRINVFGEMLLLNKNLASGYKNQEPTLNIGFNYKFK